MRSKRILVVDDEPNVVKSCARMLELEGFEVQGATSGTEAIALYKGDHFDLVLVDLKMPGMGGLQVLTALKEYNPDVTVVIFTAYSTKENILDALRLGAREFLEKPLDAKYLVSTVHRILEQKDDSTAVRGNLRSISLPVVIQINCAEHNQARLRVRRRGQEGYIFFTDGNVVHAALGSRVGEEAIYELLTWEDGDFELEMGVPAPERTITTGWSGLLLEGMRRIDESAAGLVVDWDEMEITEERMENGGESMERLARGLSRVSGVEGVVICSQEGTILGQGADGDPVKMATVTTSLGRRAEALGHLTGAGAFKQFVRRGGERGLLIVAYGQNYIGLSLTRQAAAETVAPVVQTTLRRYR